jgi:hypothetical protein
MGEVLTVRAALELEVFQRTKVRVFAGEDRLDHPVRWVHTGEIPDIHRFLSGEEMLLTAGLGMGRTAGLQRAFVRRLADARAAVLVVELAGRVFDAMSAPSPKTRPMRRSICARHQPPRFSVLGNRSGQLDGDDVMESGAKARGHVHTVGSEQPLDL